MCEPEHNSKRIEKVSAIKIYFSLCVDLSILTSQFCYLNFCKSFIRGDRASYNQSRPVQTPLGARPCIGTQNRYEAAGDLLVKVVTT